MHFFNPVALMPLVELICTPGTSDAELATADESTRKLGKTPVLVRDAPAFVVNRLLTRMTGVVVGSLERGNTVEEADAGIMAPRPADGAVRAPPDGRPARREPRARDAARGVPRPVPSVADARELRERQRRDRRHGAPATNRRARSRAPRSRRSPTSAATSSRRGRRERERHRHVHAARRRLSVLPRRDYEAPRPDGHLRAGVGRPLAELGGERVHA